MEESRSPSLPSAADTERERAVFAEAILSLIPITTRKLLVDPLPDAALKGRLLARNPAIAFADDAAARTCDAALVASDQELARRLRHLAGKVSDAGSCTIYAGNPHYWRFADSWLTGSGPPARPGLALEEMIQAIAKAGLNVLKIRRVRLDLEDAKSAAEALNSFGKRHGLSVQALFDRIAPLGFVIQTRPRAMTRRPATITGKTLGSKPDAMAVVRMHGPLEGLGTLPDFSLTSVAPQSAGQAAPPGKKHDIFLWQRPILTAESRPAIERIVTNHRIFVVEFDDHPMRWPAIAENNHLNFIAPHAVRTSTETLAAILRKWNPNVFVSPNQIETLPPFRPVEERAGPVRLLFAALNRKQDWTPYIQAVNRVLTRYPSNVLRVDVIFDQAFFDALEVRNKRFYPIMALAEYKALLSQSDVAWLPLEDTLFNRCKSDLKFIECAAHSVAVVASPVVYDTVVRMEETGLIYRSTRELTACLARLIEDKALRGRLSRAAHDEIATTRLRAQHVAGEARWYGDLLERGGSLEEERIARLAKIGATASG